MPVVSVRYVDDFAVLVVKTKTGKEFETKVDVDNVDRLKNFNWYQNAYGYVVAKDPADPRPGPRLFIHRVVMGAAEDEVVDHEYGDTLDNRRSKLRKTNRQGNGQHRVKLSRKNRSGRTGVRRSPKGDRWVAVIKVGYESVWLGTHDTYEEAVAAREAAEQIYCGEFSPKA